MTNILSQHQDKIDEHFARELETYTNIGQCWDAWFKISRENQELRAKIMTKALEFSQSFWDYIRIYWWSRSSNVEIHNIAKARIETLFQIELNSAGTVEKCHQLYHEIDQSWNPPGEHFDLLDEDKEAFFVQLVDKINMILKNRLANTRKLKEIWEIKLQLIDYHDKENLFRKKVMENFINLLKLSLIAAETTQDCLQLFVTGQKYSIDDIDNMILEKAIEISKTFASCYKIKPYINSYYLENLNKKLFELAKTSQDCLYLFEHVKWGNNGYDLKQIITKAIKLAQTVDDCLQIQEKMTHKMDNQDKEYFSSKLGSLL